MISKNLLLLLGVEHLLKLEENESSLNDVTEMFMVGINFVFTYFSILKYLIIDT